MPKFDLTQTALILQAANDNAEMVIRLPQNHPYRVDVPFSPEEHVDIDPRSRQHTPSPDGSRPELHLRFDQNMIDPSHGWVFGIDGSKSDILLGDCEEARREGRALSARHFSIRYDLNQGNLNLFNESQHGISYGDNEPSGRRPKCYALEPEKPKKLEVEDIHFWILYPKLDVEQESKHQANWKPFAQKCKEAMPMMGNLMLSSYATTRPRSNPETPRLNPILWTGTKGLYQIPAELDLGGPGIVKARRMDNGLLYPVRITKKPAGTDMSQYLKEELGLHGCSHENLVAFVDFSTNQSSIALIMNHKPQGNLRDFVNGDRMFSRAEVKSIMSQALKGLEYLHGQGCTHREISPENIAVEEPDPSFKIKLSGFHAATFERNPSGEFGAKPYRPPEMQFGSLYDNKVDIWSLAVTMFELDRGISDEWKNMTVVQWADKIQEAVLKVFFFKADRFIELLTRMLYWDKTSRLSARACLREEGLALLEGDVEYKFRAVETTRPLDLQLLMADPFPATPTQAIVQSIEAAEPPQEINQVPTTLPQNDSIMIHSSSGTHEPSPFFPELLSNEEFNFLDFEEILTPGAPVNLQDLHSERSDSLFSSRKRPSEEPPPAREAPALRNG